MGWNGEGGAEAPRKYKQLFQNGFPLCGNRAHGTTRWVPRWGALGGGDPLRGNWVGVISAKRSGGGANFWRPTYLGMRRGGSPQVSLSRSAWSRGARSGRSKMDGSRGQEGVWGSCGVTFNGPY